MCLTFVKMHFVTLLIVDSLENWHIWYETIVSSKVQYTIPNLITGQSIKRVT